MSFSSEFQCFLSRNGISFGQPSADVFSFDGFHLRIVLVSLSSGDALTVTKSLDNEPDTIYLYEDMWMRRRDFAEKRILAHLGKFRNVFARKCFVKRIDSDTAAAFLNRNHAYGNAASRYKYGMYLGEELVAVSCFSSPRRMPRIICGQEKLLRSYEWVRYASLPDCRISGGMGKMLKAFIEDVHPEEIMSYADLEWSRGETYRKLGFKEAGSRPPVTFYLNRETWKRLRKPAPETIEFVNLGSRKYLLNNLEN
ncbi:MAG: hypothetical protein IJS02_02010 [Bacteroidales bacterium]|nr:hypothetical protein [Bacteroidales bacterium]